MEKRLIREINPGEKSKTDWPMKLNHRKTKKFRGSSTEKTSPRENISQ